MRNEEEEFGIVLDHCGDATGYFLNCFEMDKKSKQEDIIILTYYAFTTLSTVGFGDLHPKSNIERIFIAFFMLLGVAVFSYIMGNFIEMIDVVKNQNAENEYHGELLKFFAFINQNYNG